MVRLKYGSYATDTVSGVIIYPDDFSFSEAGVASMPFGARRPVTQINAADWETLEEAGCVFLPSIHIIIGSDNTLKEESVGQYVHSWSTNAQSAGDSYRAFWDLFTFRCLPSTNMARFNRATVRLVQDL